MGKKAKSLVSVHLGDLHHALLKYISVSDPAVTRNAQIRLAIEFYVMSQPAWSHATFEAFLKTSATAGDADSRDAILTDYRRLTRISHAHELLDRPGRLREGDEVCQSDFDV